MSLGAERGFYFLFQVTGPPKDAALDFSEAEKLPSACEPKQVCREPNLGCAGEDVNLLGKDYR